MAHRKRAIRHHDLQLSLVMGPLPLSFLQRHIPPGPWGTTPGWGTRRGEGDTLPGPVPSQTPPGQPLGAAPGPPHWGMSTRVPQ